MQRVNEFFKKAETYYFATVDGDQPRVRSFGTVNIFECELYIQTGKIKPTAKQIDANPKVEICTMAAVGDNTRNTYRILKDSSISKVTLEWNKGGHFSNPTQRLVKGMLWLSRQK